MPRKGSSRSSSGAQRCFAAAEWAPNWTQHQLRLREDQAMGSINKTFGRRARSGLVTGGSRELDLQIAEALSEQGAKILLSSWQGSGSRAGPETSCRFPHQGQWIAADNSRGRIVHFGRVSRNSERTTTAFAPQCFLEGPYRRTHAGWRNLNEPCSGFCHLERCRSI